MQDRFRDRIYRSYVSGKQNKALAGTKNELNARLPYFKRIVDKHFPQKRSVSILELGCGYGALIHAANLRGYHNIRGIDRSLEQVTTAQNLGINRVYHADVMDSLDNECNSSLDCVICFDIFEHFDRDELMSVSDSIYRILRKDGSLIIHVPNAESPFGMKIRYGDITHELAFTQGSIRQLLISSGFQNVECFEDEPIAHGAISLFRLFAWKILRLLYRFVVAIETGDLGRNSIYSQNLLAIAKK